MDTDKFSFCHSFSEIEQSEDNYNSNSIFSSFILKKKYMSSHSKQRSIQKSFEPTMQALATIS